MKKPKCTLIGQDNNIFLLFGIASKTLREAGMEEEAGEMKGKVLKALKVNDYEEAISIIGEYVEIS